MSRTKEVTLSDFYCTCCGSKGIPLPRKVSKQTEAGHLKKIYCLHCQEETNHVEIRSFGCYRYEDFKKEFDLGRFVDGNRVPVTDLESCGFTNCKYNVDGKCWNAQHKNMEKCLNPERKEG